MSEEKECYIGSPSPYFVRVLKTPRELAIAIEGALHLAATYFRAEKMPWPASVQEARLAHERWQTEAQRLKKQFEEDDAADRWKDERQRINIELRVYNTFNRARALKAIYHLLEILEALEDPAKCEDWALEADAPDEASSEGTLCYKANWWLILLGASLKGM